MELFNTLKDKAVACKQRIVLPESTEYRTLQAANQVIAEGIADIILIGEPSDIYAKTEELCLTHINQARIVNPNDPAQIEKYAEIFFELRKSKGITMDEARIKAKDPLYLGCLLIKAGEADGQVAGAKNTTGNVLRAAFQVIKTAPGISAVSGAFLMLLPPGLPYGTDGMLVFADCAHALGAQWQGKMAGEIADFTDFFIRSKRRQRRILRGRAGVQEINFKSFAHALQITKFCKLVKHGLRSFFDGNNII